MWTVCWTDKHSRDRWNRYDNLDQLFADKNLQDYLDDEDTIVFPPASDEDMMDGMRFVEEYGSTYNFTVSDFDDNTPELPRYDSI